MLIAFVHDHNSFMPEVAAYQRFFSQKGCQVAVIKSGDALTAQPAVEWHLMGMHLKKRFPAAVLIHEYTSASAPPFRILKDFFKRTLNLKPDYRLYLNKFVKEQLHFTDNVPNGFRDMFVISNNRDLLPRDPYHYRYDFIYMGNLHKTRKLETLFQHFTTGLLSNRSLLILTQNYQQLQQKFQTYPNVHFKGPVSPFDIGPYLSQCRFGINFIPDERPFNEQTSTKVLEYCAHQLPVITTSYKWIKQFEQQYGGRFFYVNKDLSNFSWEAVTGFNYTFPDLRSWTLENQLRLSGILEFLDSKFSHAEWTKGV